MNVEIKDRKEGAECLRMALNMCELYITYPHAELIIKVLDKMQKSPDKFTIKDAVEIHSEWKSKWDEYSKTKKIEQ